MAKLHDDLLLQAQELLSSDPTKPKQASLRRAVSSAYYALFHFLIDRSVRSIVGTNPDDEPIRAIVTRRYLHKTMNSVCRETSLGKFSGKAALTLQTVPLEIPEALRDIASTFVELQSERHDADYDIGRRFTRGEATLLVERAAAAFDNWQSIASTQATRFFLIWLLVGRGD